MFHSEYALWLKQTCLRGAAVSQQVLGRAWGRGGGGGGGGGGAKADAWAPSPVWPLNKQQQVLQQGHARARHGGERVGYTVHEGFGGY